MNWSHCDEIAALHRCPASGPWFLDNAVIVSHDAGQFLVADPRCVGFKPNDWCIETCARVGVDGGVDR